MATNIGFEGIVSGAPGHVPATPYLESGYLVTSNNVSNGIFGATDPLYNTNGTDIFGWCASNCGVVQTLVLTGPDAFNLLSIDIGGLTLDDFVPGISVDLTGNFSGGGSIFLSLQLTDTWTTHLIPGFTDLLSLEITAVNPNPNDFGDLAMDNLNVATVPEPSTFVLLGCGLLALVARRRAASSRC